MSAEKTVTHLLDERDETQTYAGYGARWWTAEWFPFKAQVDCFEDSSGNRWSWKLYFVGADYPFAQDYDVKTWSAAFQGVADAKKDALAKLREQLQ